jgi:hypothetical protein
LKNDKDQLQWHKDDKNEISETESSQAPLSPPPQPQTPSATIRQLWIDPYLMETDSDSELPRENLSNYTKCNSKPTEDNLEHEKLVITIGEKHVRELKPSLFDGIPKGRIICHIEEMQKVRGAI